MTSLSLPVRGCLSPYDPKTPKGWRWIQCTDTLDQFRVLLPPPTASAYEKLLQCEALEVTKDPPLWQRILEIRHIKERMIRKCQRLSSNLPPTKVGRGQPFLFQSVIAPDDFHMKQLNAFLSLQPVKSTETPVITKRHSSQSVGAKNYYCCSRCSTPTADPSGSLKHSTSTFSLPPASHLQQVDASSPVPIPPPSFQQPFPAKKDLSTIHEVQSNASTPALPVPLALPELNVAAVMSPPPLPLQPRSQDEIPPIVMAHYSTDPLGTSPSPPNTASTDSRDSKSSPPADASSGRPPLQRRRSILKRSSISDIVKSVSWADKGDLDAQIARVKAATSEEDEGSKGLLDEIRSSYVDQMSSLDLLQKKIEDNLEYLQTEVNRLQDVESTIRFQKENLRSTFDDFERTRLRLQEKVTNALQSDLPASPPADDSQAKDPDPAGSTNE